jgi:uncharacterized CHY-type Zn-finger protein
MRCDVCGKRRRVVLHCNVHKRKDCGQCHEQLNRQTIQTVRHARLKGYSTPLYCGHCRRLRPVDTLIECSQCGLWSCCSHEESHESGLVAHAMA